MEIDRNGLEVLGRDDCLRLLATATLGRVGLTSDALPYVLPVNFTLVSEHILFRTGRGTKLEAATRNAVVAFEADAIDPMSHTGWSVMVTAIARELADPAHLDPSSVTAIPRWASRDEGRVIALDTNRVSGRRLHPWGPGVTPTEPLSTRGHHPLEFGPLW